MKIDYKHKDFVTTAEQHKGRQIERISKPYPQYYKIVLRSSDRDAASTREDARFSNITMSENFHGAAVLLVDSFTLVQNNPPVVKQAIEIRLRNLPQPRSWDSSTRGLSDVLCVFSGNEFKGNTTVDSVGVPLFDLNQLQNQSWNVYFKDATNGTAVQFDGDWVLVLNVIALDDSMPY